jgi:hypothetical protein
VRIDFGKAFREGTAAAQRNAQIVYRLGCKVLGGPGLLASNPFERALQRARQRKAR